MTEQEYRELITAVKESGIALDMQKEIQRCIDEQFVSTEKPTVEKDNLYPGNTVEFEGQEWNVLDEVEENKFLCVNNDIICEKEFDEDDNNNWKESSLRRYLNGEYLEKFKDVNLVSWQQDLTTDDGLEDYGSSEDKIFLLTTDQYRKYRKHIRDVQDWWWLITADSIENSYVRYVDTDGSLFNGNAYRGTSGVRPACVIDISI